MSYYHSYELRHLLRPIAARYPKTYKRVGEQLVKQKRTQETGATLEAEILAWIAAMPPHVQPYKCYTGNEITWGEIDWPRTIKVLKES